MADQIDSYLPGTGRMLGEGDAVVNVADLVGEIKAILEEIRDGGGGGVAGDTITRYDLGAPAAPANNMIAMEAMKNGAYTVLTNPDVCRNIMVVRQVNGDPDTPGTITIVGTDYNDVEISEEITPGDNGVEVQGAKAFKTVTSITGSGWTAAGDADTLIVVGGYGLGLPYIEDSASDVLLFTFGLLTAVPAVAIGAAISQCMATPPMAGAGIDYDGSTHSYILVKS